MCALHLGHYDQNKTLPDPAGWLKPYHRAMSKTLKEKLQFRGEGNGEWHSFQSKAGTQVLSLQRFLKTRGFFPKAALSGIFGYGTRSALRLFQEYVRQIEGQTSIGVPDGVLGEKTQAHIDRWQADQVSCRWNRTSIFSPSEAYLTWMDILQKARTHYLASDDPVISNLRSYPQNTDSRPPEEWTFKPADTHLLGIRCHPETSFDNRPNDDIFVLLIKGMVFTFWGSTDPNPGITVPAGRHEDGDPFLSEGQHRYRFGWHKVSSAQRVYMALRPYSPGVLVFRDRAKKNQLLKDDILKGFGPPNRTINIHWTPDGDKNWSAGCQVISGESYIDDKGIVRTCKDYCAGHYNELSSKKTRGAYNFLTDLVVSYSHDQNDTVWYTLGRVNNLQSIAPHLDDQSVDGILKRLKEG